MHPPCLSRACHVQLNLTPIISIEENVLSLCLYISQFVINFPAYFFTVILMCHTRVSVMQRIMEVAYDLGMTTREYLYISYTLIPSSFNIVPWSNTQYGITTKVTEEQMAKRKEAFKVFRSVSSLN